MDQNAIISRVSARLLVDSGDPIYAQLDEMVNDAIHQLDASSTNGWPWMQTTLRTTVTTSSYTFTQLSSSLTLTKIDSIRVKNLTAWIPLERLGYEDIAQYYTTDDTGVPDSYIIEGSRVAFYPPPDGSYLAEIRAVYAEPDLGGSGSSPIMPTIFHNAIIDATLLLAYQSLLDDKRAALYEQRVAGHLARMETYGNQAGMPAPAIHVREPLYT